MRYISILRGINVSGQKKIKMEDLKSLYEGLELKNIVTYIQSGNVIFDTSITSKNTLKAKIESAIQETYKFNVPVLIRTADEINSIIKKYPFGCVDVVSEGTKVLVTFLSSSPEKQLLDGMQKYVQKPDRLHFSGEQVYISCPNGYGKSKLSNTFIESKLNTQATTRNWKTIIKLCELSEC